MVVVLKMLNLWVCVGSTRFWLPDPSADVTGRWAGGDGFGGGARPKGHLWRLWSLCQCLAGHGGEMCVRTSAISTDLHALCCILIFFWLCLRWSHCPSRCWIRGLVKMLSSRCTESSRFRVSVKIYIHVFLSGASANPPFSNTQLSNSIIGIFQELGNTWKVSEALWSQTVAVDKQSNTLLKCHSKYEKKINFHQQIKS